ncbi:MAG: repair protein SbcC/Rad50 [Pseudomonadota bacterium]|nr:repair protein SbcC/Rad50 [Pseudomonadota bacterium]
MKIRKLRFKNLNSLAGEWICDFTHPEYLHIGIFAITGPTGAGKSTILDAICLALYGQTPRLGAITKTTNEIMSRRTGEAFAELEFSTNEGIYRCYWEQIKARKNADGNLQQVKRELADISNHTILESQINSVNKRIVEIIGMDFEHFTRAMLLAQGSFAKFLQATPDERSPILEQITGTKIYSEISQKVHERKTVEEKKLELINAGLSGISLLTDAEIAELEIQLTNTQNNYRQIAKTKTDLDKQLRWLEELNKIETELEAAEAKQSELTTKQDNFTFKANQLSLAEKANEINSDIYLRLIELRNQTTEISNNLGKHKQSLPELEQQQSLSKDNLSNQQQDFSNFKQYSTNQLKLIQQVRELDTKLINIKKSVTKLNGNLELANFQFKTKQTETEKLQADLNNKQIQLKQTNIYTEKHLADGELVTKFSGIINTLDNLTQTFNDEQNLQYELDTCKEEYHQLEQLQDAAQHKQKQLNSHITQQQTKLDELIVTQRSLSPDKNISELNKNQIQLKDKQLEFDKLHDLITAQQKIANELDSSQLKLQTQNQELSSLIPQLKTMEEHLNDIGHLITSLNEQIVLENKVLSLSKEREKLQKNHPCPLCGSLEHPYALHTPLVNSDSQQKIIHARTRQQELHNKKTELSNQIAVSQTTIDGLIQKINELTEQRSEQQTKITKTISNLSLPGFIHQQNLTELADDVVTHMHKLTAEIAQLEQTIDILNQLDLQHEQLRQELQNKIQEQAQITIDITTLSAQLTATRDKMHTITENISKQQTKITTAKQQLMPALTNYGINEIQPQSIAEIKQLLTARLTNWNEQQQLAVSLNQQISEINQLIKQNQLLQNNIHEQLQQLNAELTVETDQYTSFEQERQQLFANKDPEQEQQLIQSQLTIHEQNLKQAEINFNQIQQQVLTTNSLITNLEQQLIPVRDQQTQAETIFINKLNQYEFAEENEFKQALLPREQLLLLQNEAESLRAKKIELATQQQQLTAKLTLIKQNQLSTLNHDELIQTIDQLNNQIDITNQTIGGIKTKLESNKQAQAQQAQIIGNRDKQQQETNRWQQLHALIGSADGKKFRNFAQGLTFDVVVKNANAQLQKMSDRYLLMRDDAAPLELNVIDNYQGGEQRTTKNLSGGESFIVSLALALGLSKLSSNKVQVDSLFLDEGFGTLDEDSLQTALEALASLQQEGKLIGVISHVGALKERINLQIQVEPLAGGVSRISGVGCHKV